MKTRLAQLDFKYFPIGVIVLYIPFHLLEEAYSNFPQWMFEHYSLPQPLSYPHWLINNFVFWSVLLFGLIIFFKDKIKYLSFGIGMLFWGLLNSIEHITFSIIDNALSPGFYTALLFLMVFILGIMNLYGSKLLNTKLLVKSFLIAISYIVLSVVIIVLIGTFLVKIFP